ncbi:sulfatase-like hydrolase/transferase [Roseobacter sp. HKCCD9010]|uniref:sulfatase-like hydrolase/transferase n=1 Tax=unclassified Roseobacter TaxID=196798 RepID=UPI001491ADBE|nr:MULTISPECIES: sulfatase-like hydrolase/transferase [unclassified Roseobacter]MBF9052124.1 sulfatase-like hydrolase/transferase [Rhodobacterales bacterium HKCCD4356]NNV14044.1 sulfatase-like hydrolase/transferase [Roseobacter sp. HKCCD7357]NNV18282.1 sulfatase-like hydrolase/transferase [Roseobacter sp. HKCCD8768]NNV27743.1 sulfatase-like hydrolase/transferase [Roseobacter sp. HKCCD8192]NNV32018.1 sulfatase-like hydrolase/transferase [Roseobacter sp. HKCCD9061]
MTRPNVLLIVTDHWSANLLGAAGHPAIRTPTLDQLAQCGTRYTNAYSEHPVCIPARRTLMTGTSAREHGDRTFQAKLPMPAQLPTMAQSFRDAGYQAYGVGKTHTYPQRDRLGFDDILMDDEGRTHHGVTDDYEIFLGDQGYLGKQFGHGISNNGYAATSWHLPEEAHATNWATEQMCRIMRRRDPARPAFWYLGYRHPHPPLVPPQRFLEFYRDVDLDEAYSGDWTDDDDLPLTLQAFRARYKLSHGEAQWARKHFYALCTQIDQQIGRLIGTLREEGQLDNTIVMFTSDHGESLGNHGIWAKQNFYEASASIPMLLLGVKDCPRVGNDQVDDRLVCLADIMPTLLDLAGVRVPGTVTGRSMLGERRDHLYGEFGEGELSSRMIHDGRHKLIYYAAGNRCQLFDLEADPMELSDLADDPGYGEILDRLKGLLIAALYGSDQDWLTGSTLTGLPNRRYRPAPNRGLGLMRGHQWPVPPVNPDGLMNFFPEQADRKDTAE